MVVAVEVFLFGDLLFDAILGDTLCRPSVLKFSDQTCALCAKLQGNGFSGMTLYLRQLSRLCEL
jgi:hypothetical protein